MRLPSAPGDLQQICHKTKPVSTANKTGGLSAVCEGTSQPEDLTHVRGSQTGMPAADTELLIRGKG